MSKIALAPAPAYMSRIGEEVAKAEPAAYGSQSKPRGRKPKKATNVEKSDDHDNGDDADDMDCPPDLSKRPRKRKGKGKKNKRGSKKSTKKSTKKSIKKSRKGKRKATKNAKTANLPDLEDHDDYEPSESGVHDLDTAKGSDVPGDVPGSSSVGALRKAKAKGSKSKGKKKNMSSPVDPDPLEPGLAVDLPPNMAYPPDWVKAGNVYSNSYRRAKAEGKGPEEIKEFAKDCTARFRQWGAVDTDLLTSFGLSKGKSKRRRTAHPGPEDGHPEGHEGDGMDNENGMDDGDGIAVDDAA